MHDARGAAASKTGIDVAARELIGGRFRMGCGGPGVWGRLRLPNCQFFLGSINHCEIGNKARDLDRKCSLKYEAEAKRIELKVNAASCGKEQKGAKQALQQLQQPREREGQATAG